MLRDLLFSVRKLRQHPGFTLIIVLTLGLGIGATSSVFSLIQGVLLTPPPYREPERLALITSFRNDGSHTTAPRGWASQQWTEWQKDSKSFESIAAYRWTFNFLIRSEETESLEGMVVTQNYFRVMGLQPIIGRTFLESEAGATPAPVIILGYDAWKRKFSSDPNIVGKKVRISRRDTPPTVIGVMPAGARFLPVPGAAQEPNYNVNALVDFWAPASLTHQRIKQPDWNLVGRLKAGASLPQAERELSILAARQSAMEPDFAGVSPRVISVMAEANRDGQRILLPLLGAAALVLLIACGNAAALLLVRGLQRQQEYAVCTALGMRRLRLFSQVSTEGLLLALIGGVFGVSLAFGAVKVLRNIGGHAIPRLDQVTAGWPVLGFALTSAVLAAVIAGLYPALRASRMDPIEVLKTAGPKSSTGPAERRLLHGVAIVQTALTLTLLVGAGLLIRTMLNVSNVQAGFDTTRILTITVTSVQGNWSDFHHRTLERVSAIPGVQSAAFAWGVPLTGNNWPGALEIEGQPVAMKASDRLTVPLRSVTPEYFQLLSQTMLEGRGFRSTDTQNAPNVSVINQALAHRYFPDGNAIGKKLWLGGRERPPTEIVGVVTNGRTDDLTQAPEPEIYLCLWQANAYSKHLVVRTSGDPRSLAAAIQREVRSVEPTAALENVKTMEQIRNDSLAPRIFATQLLSGFSVVGSILTLVGIYGVLSLTVASRRREIAIRTAVGAEQRHIRNLVFSEGMRLIAAGILAGLVAALVLSRVVKSFLFGVEANDPLTLLTVGVLFVSVALLACWAPIRRALKVSPVEALRYE